MIIASPKMQTVYRQALLCAESEVDVLLLGESGTGKEVLAGAIHQHSRCAGKPFVALNCGSIPATLIASEFFGHERGAFTDVRERRIGKFEQAQGGTLFLDEVGELSPEAQVALLRVLETRQFTRVGGNQPITVDVRIMAATNRDLARQVREQRFREDLYWRLSVVPLMLPPLRERPEEILPLADYFLGELKPKLGRALTLTPTARKKLTLYSYPGNVRELRNTILRAAALCGGGSIDAEHITFTNARAQARFELYQIIERLGGVRAAARALECSPQALYKRLKRYSIENGCIVFKAKDKR